MQGFYKACNPLLSLPYEPSVSHLIIIRLCVKRDLVVLSME